jgi:heat shock protein HslJ
MNGKALIIAVGALLGTSACTPQALLATDPPAEPPRGSAPMPEPTGTRSWFITTASGTVIEANTLRMRPTLEIDGNQVSGHAGCNRFNARLLAEPSGAVTAVSSTDTVQPWLDGPVATTRMMCEPAAMTVERAVTGALSQAVSLREGTGVAEVLGLNGTVLMRLMPVNIPVETQALSGRVWQLISIDGRTNNATQRPTLEVGTDQVAGSTGCNRFNSPITISGNRYTLGQGLMTQMACVEDARNVTEAAYMDALSGQGTWQITGNRLTLTGPKGVLIFEAQ